MNIKEIASQPKLHSFYESVFNIVVGLGINVTAQLIIFPLFGMYISAVQTGEIAGIFTVISLVRSFFLRRLMNWWHIKNL